MRKLPWLALLLLIPGCGKNLVAVSGKVEYADGSVFEGGRISFVAADKEGAPNEGDPKDGNDPKGDGKAKGPKVSPHAEIKEDGTFRMGTFQADDGVYPGKYKILITPQRPRNPDRPPKDWPPLNPAVYSSPEKTPLEVEITRAKRDLNLVVQKWKR